MDVILGKGKLGKRMERPLWRWIRFVDGYCRERWAIDEDNPYWNNERGSLGILAAAIWSTGGLAVEELPAEKKKGRRTITDARLDLWCSLGRDDYAFEAKQRHIRLSLTASPTQVKKRLQGALTIAAGNVKEKPGYGKRASLVFAVPYVRGTRRAEPVEMRHLLQVFVDAIKQCDASFAAWCIQPKGRCTWSYWPRKGRTDYYYWPGVAVIGRALRRQ